MITAWSVSSRDGFFGVGAGSGAGGFSSLRRPLERKNGKSLFKIGLRANVA